ncbi:mannosyl-glycoprotein endo-beta-N-acetylglucosaminidase [Peptostreptococcaceae bacterium AS15]|nr:mannosyl-glycoprotein endo-beta-N-acetylglucosaminidase [Peptostreptococcaceae bacterium AS15]
MEIKINSYIKNYTGPSQNYYNTTNRFESILKDKLGVTKKQDLKINQDDTLIFEMDESSELDNFSKLLVKDISSVVVNGLIDTNDIRKKTNYSASYLDNKLKNTPLEGLGEDFKRAEDLYGVNAVVLMAMAKLESNFGRSKIAQEKNNLFGFGAYDSSPYASAKSYTSKKDSIYDVARHLSNNYLRQGGSYFEGYSIDSVNKNYSTDKAWASKIKKISSEIMNL